MTIRVSLTPAEMMQAALVGVMRQVSNLRDGRKDAHGFDGDGWSVHVEGAAGELAVAKALDKFWSGNQGNLKADDVGTLQVRTRSRPGYELVVHDRDPDERPFVLARGRAPHFEIVGWLMGREAKRPEFWKDPAGGRPAYFVPDAALRPIEELPR